MKDTNYLPVLAAPACIVAAARRVAAAPVRQLARAVWRRQAADSCPAPAIGPASAPVPARSSAPVPAPAPANALAASVDPRAPIRAGSPALRKQPCSSPRTAAWPRAAAPRPWPLDS
eukprot:6201094-Pleurochrysis_carterae.AAC.5